VFSSSPLSSSSPESWRATTKSGTCQPFWQIQCQLCGHPKIDLRRLKGL
jgi:hypothetical protein